MIEIAAHWRILAASVATATAGVLGLGGGSASAQPLVPQPPPPAPATVVAPTVVAPLAQPGVGPAATGTPAGTVAPGLLAVPVAAPPVATIAPAASGTLSEFFAAKGVALEPQTSRDFTALTIVLPMPRGWAHVPDPNVPDAFAVIADRVGGNGLYTSNATVVVYKLVGDFDPKEAVSHGFVDSQQLPAWRATDASLADFGGLPSALIEGTYRENALTLNTSRRHVIATTGPDRYLVSLSVTTSVDQAVAAADATDAIINGYRVGVPGPPRPAAAPLAPGSPAPAVAAGLPTVPAVPAAPVAPAFLGLPG